MRLAALLCSLLAAALLPAAAGAAPPHKPQRVMTVMLCADQYAMMLLPPQRISSITYLSADGSVTPELDAQARRTRLNHGLAEEMLAQKPDLIVGGAFSALALRRLAKRLGVPVIELEPAYTFDDIRRQTRLLGRAFGEQARAEALVARMDATLAALARTAPTRPVAAVAWNSGGRTPGRRSMFNAILEAAGGVNLAGGDDTFERSLDLEQLLRLRPRPDLLLNAVSGKIGLGEQADLVRHPVLDKAFKGRRLAYPEAAYQCGTPYAADQAVALRRAMATVAPR